MLKKRLSLVGSALKCNENIRRLNMKISLIIPAYNEEVLIDKTLKSVMKAKANFEKIKSNTIEVILVDNDSEDRTVEIAKPYQITIVSEEIHNIAKVRNTGAKHATGDVLCFLDADSEISSNMFELIKHYMETGKYVGGGTKFKLDRRNLTFSLIFVASVLVTHIIGLSGVMLYTKKEYFDALGGFNEQFYAAEDIDFVLRLRDYGRRQGLKYCNIYRGYVITSSRKFKMLKFKDLFMQGGLMLHKSLRENPKKCEQWYNAHKH
jgi:glycosyltransferase involved in cell wall biosynthesis